MMGLPFCLSLQLPVLHFEAPIDMGKGIPLLYKRC
jgi:hypothetical protein